MARLMKLGRDVCSTGIAVPNSLRNPPMNLAHSENSGIRSISLQRQRYGLLVPKYDTANTQYP